MGAGHLWSDFHGHGAFGQLFSQRNCLHRPPRQLLRRIGLRDRLALRQARSIFCRDMRRRRSGRQCSLSMKRSRSLRRKMRSCVCQAQASHRAERRAAERDGAGGGGLYQGDAQPAGGRDRPRCAGQSHRPAARPGRTAKARLRSCTPRSGIDRAALRCATACGMLSCPAWINIDRACFAMSATCSLRPRGTPIDEDGKRRNRGDAFTQMLRVMRRQWPPSLADP